jgi:hypothetical protein
MYGAQGADQMRYGAERQQLMLDAANSKYAGDRVKLQDRANRLAGTLGGGAAAPTLATQQDVRQADEDASKAAARRRLMTMVGLGGALGGAIGQFPGAVLGGLTGSRLGRG